MEALVDTSATLAVLNKKDEAHEEAKKALQTAEEYSYVDAACFAVMERHGIEIAFAFDDDFAKFGFSTLTEAR